MVSNDFFRKISKLRIPLVTQVEVTRRCNFRCPFCYLGEAACIDIDKEQLMKTLEEIHSLGGMKVLFTGGEPLLYTPLLEITHYDIQVLNSIKLRTMLLVSLSG